MGWTEEVQYFKALDTFEYHDNCVIADSFNKIHHERGYMYIYANLIHIQR